MAVKKKTEVEATESKTTSKKKSTKKVEKAPVEVATVPEVSVEEAKEDIGFPEDIIPETVEEEAPTTDVVEIPEVEEEEKVSVDMTAKPEKKKAVVSKDVKIRLRVDHSCCIAKVHYTFKANGVYTVPKNVKTILNRAGLLAPL